MFTIGLYRIFWGSALNGMGKKGSLTNKLKSSFESEAGSKGPKGPKGGGMDPAL